MPGDNRKQMVFDILNGHTGQAQFVLTKHKRSADSQQYADHEIMPAYFEADAIS